MNKQSYNIQIYSEVMHMLDYFATETGVPPMYVCLHTAILCLSNIKGYYEASNKEIPEDLKRFCEVGYAKLLEDMQETIEIQYTALNTEGTA